MTPEQQAALRSLPSMTHLLSAARAQTWAEHYSDARLSRALRLAVDRTRKDILAGRLDTTRSAETLIDSARRSLEEAGRLNLRPVINATGIVLHTGLGRAPLSDAAVDALIEIASGYSNVEFDLGSGQRGERNDLVIELLTELTGAQDAAVVNNNAAATLLVLNELSDGKNAVVSRGELIEIGGSFRLPEIMQKSGAIMREVGTTNRTRLADYEQAIDDRTGLLVHVHTSNYRVVGFAESVTLSELSELGRRHGVLVYHDLGSGALVDLSERGLPDEPFAAGSLRAGADVVTFSGDKLLGGPQCGLIVGTTEVIGRVKRNPLMRALRVGKLTLAALEATLRQHLDAGRAYASVPALRMLTCSTEEVARRAETLRAELSRAVPADRFEILGEYSYAGGGSLPTVRIPTTTVAWRPSGCSPDRAARALRRSNPPIITRIKDDAVILDLRTLRDEEIPVVRAVVADVASPSELDG